MLTPRMTAVVVEEDADADGGDWWWWVMMVKAGDSGTDCHNDMNSDSDSDDGDCDDAGIEWNLNLQIPDLCNIFTWVQADRVFRYVTLS